MFQEEMPWWKSRIIIGAVVSILTKLLVVSGVTGEIDLNTNTQIVDIVLLLIGAVGDLTAIKARVVQTRAPTITLTKN